ncbi:MAG TPA: pilus assembly protein PilP [Vicinamibacterales bacterium]|nr:pilus assembly protein PilP [Vicinamibacterales bacterium]
MTATLPLLIAFALAGAQAPAGQPPPAQPPAAGTPAPSRGGVGPPAPPQNYSYEIAGRRDPFISLVNRGTDSGGPQAGSVRPDGIAGILVDEVVVRGIVQSRGGYMAMIGAPSGRTYSVRPGDRLMDGTVRAITPQAVVLMQEVNDPLSLEKQREVRKFLRAEVK